MVPNNTGDAGAHTPALPDYPSISAHTLVDGRFEVVRELGRGGMATVYLCTDRTHNHPVALKLLRREIASAVAVERFFREIEFSSELDHPRIPKVMHTGMYEGTPYYVMTYVDGESLRRRMMRERQLPIEEAVRIACGVVEPMAYAHASGVVHRDLKPENILLASDGVYVLDFGVARAVIQAAGESLTSTGVVVGTPAYMSPEQALGDHQLDPRSDIYALGCIVYEMIGGLPPWVGATPQAMIYRRFASKAAPISEHREGVPQYLEEAIARALCKAPADRFATAEEFAAALRIPRPTTPSVPVEAVAFPAATSKRKLVVRGAVAAFALMGTLAAARELATNSRSSAARAMKALASWELSEAETMLDDVSADADAAAADKLLLAQLMFLNGKPAVEWKQHLLSAIDRKTELSSEQQLRAEALLEITSANFVSACEKLRRVPAADPAARLLLADCIRTDSFVVADPTSPSGFRFSSSYNEAGVLYRGLLERHARNAAAYAVLFPRLEEVMPLSRSEIRRGVPREGPRRRFLALPVIDADTIAYIPDPLPSASAPWRTRDPQRVTAAIARNRQQLRELAENWMDAAPNEPLAHETYARILELSGEVGGGQRSAIHHVNSARRLIARTPATSQRYLQQIRLGAEAARMHLRVSDFAAAGFVADTVLSLRPHDGLTRAEREEASEVLYSIAELRGRGLTAIRAMQAAASDYLVRLPDGEVATLPPAVVPDVVALQGYTLFGGPADSIRATLTRVSEALDGLVPPRRLEAYKLASMARPLAFAAPVIGPGAIAQLQGSSDLYGLSLRALARNDKRGARAFLDSLAELHSEYAPGEITMDVVYQKAWLRSTLGDTVGAARELDVALRGLPAALPNLLKRPALTASFVRAMALRSELAMTLKQTETARKWSDAVYHLWGSGDMTVAGTVAKIRHIRQLISQ